MIEDEIQKLENACEHWQRIARVMFNRCWVQPDRMCRMCEFREDCERERTIKAEE